MKVKSLFLISWLLCIVSVCKSSIQIPEKALSPDKTLSFAFNRFYFKDTIKFVECTLINNTDSTFWILAYDTVKSQEKTYIHAIFSLQEKKNGKWKDSDLGFSGNGIERFSLKPGEKLLFETRDFDPTAEAIIIGIDVRMRTSDNRLRILREIRTDEIKLPQ